MLYINNWIGTDGFEVKKENERFTMVCPRCLKLLIGSFSNDDGNGNENVM